MERRLVATTVRHMDHAQIRQSTGRSWHGRFTPGPEAQLAHANKNPVKDFCWWDLDGVVVCRRRLSCSGRWLVGPFRTINMLFYLTRPQLALLESLP